MKIIIDQRERNSDIINCLEKTGIDIERKTLPVGDYVVSNRICIERKTISDFESSLINGRLFDQIERLKQAYEFPIVLIEGNIEEFRLGLKQIIGAII
ncbi:MAG: ERCC4 domain-containing protein, partial [Candidatus Micrarchaeaceae archaeon]